jgi:hypothetical protein
MEMGLLGDGIWNVSLIAVHLVLLRLRIAIDTTEGSLYLGSTRRSPS